MENKHIIKLDVAIIVGTLTCLVFIFGYVNPKIISPINGFETTNNSILFSIEKADVILIDDNPEFTSPEKVYVKDNLVINLKPGTYYWKAEGIVESEVKRLTINSEVNLKLKNLGENYVIVNAGNTRLDVDIYNGTSLIDSIELDIDEEKEVSGTKFVGSQDE